MMKKLLLLAVLCLIGMAAQAQQNLSWGQGPQVASPDVHADNTVTFNLVAPDAQKVQITGDFLPPKKVEYQGNTYDTPGIADLVKNDKGVWSFTTDKLQPELYTYNMIVDGVKIIDPPASLTAPAAHRYSPRPSRNRSTTDCPFHTTAMHCRHGRWACS